jgi:hypothetical protein
MTDPNVDKVTLPPELVQQWYQDADNQLSPYYVYMACQAARWGADMELEACCEWLKKEGWNPCHSQSLRTARRPKPPSLKEQALLAIDTAVADDRLSAVVADVIRRALEALDND